MARPPLYETSMTKIVKFRLAENDLQMLMSLKSDDESLSECMRTLIREAHARAQ